MSRDSVTIVLPVDIALDFQVKLTDLGVSKDETLVLAVTQQGSQWNVVSRLICTAKLRLKTQQLWNQQMITESRDRQFRGEMSVYASQIALRLNLCFFLNSGKICIYMYMLARFKLRRFYY